MAGTVDFRNDQFAELLSQRFIVRPAEDLFRLRIPVSDAAVLVDLDEGIERRIDDAARQLLAFAQRFLRQPAFGHVAADEEMPPDRLRPGAHPRQRHDPPVLVNVARIEAPRTLSATGCAQFRAGALEIIVVDEFGRVAADHLIRRISEDALRTLAYLNQKALAVRDQDQ